MIGAAMSNNASRSDTRHRPAKLGPCAICGKEARVPVAFGVIRPPIAAMIAADHPALTADSAICRDHIVAYRTRYVQDILARERGEITELERQVVESLAREETISRHVEQRWRDARTAGEKVADVVADFGGSWTFIGAFFAVLFIWIAFNLWMAANSIFDPYPFILLNLALSTLAAVQAPIILMSQNRTAVRDRLAAGHDYEVNLKAEIEIAALHEKLDQIRSNELAVLMQKLAGGSEAAEPRAGA